jgi:signal transduction histidine kinase
MSKFFAGIAFFTCIAAGLIAVSPSRATPEHATAAQAKAMLERAVVALKADSATAIAKFNRANGGFRDRDLYVACFDPKTGIVQSHVDPKQLGVDIRTLKQPDGKPFGQALFDAAKEGNIATVDYEYPVPGSAQPVAKQSYVTRVGNEACLVGYYK